MKDSVKQMCARMMGKQKAYFQWGELWSIFGEILCHLRHRYRSFDINTLQ